MEAKNRDRGRSSPRFLVDPSLGKIARALRFAGLDTRMPTKLSWQERIEICETERRYLLARTWRLSDHPLLFLLGKPSHHETLIEIAEAFELQKYYRPFTICTRCNRALQTWSPPPGDERIPSAISKRFDDFRRCDRCGRIYWRGSHFHKMDRFWKATIFGELARKAET